MLPVPCAVGEQKPGVLIACLPHGTDECFQAVFLPEEGRAKPGLAQVADQFAHGPSLKVWPDANRFQSVVPAPAMPSQIGQPARAIHVEPVQLLLDSHASLIPVLQRAGEDTLGNLHEGWS